MRVACPPLKRNTRAAHMPNLRTCASVSVLGYISMLCTLLVAFMPPTLPRPPHHLVLEGQL